MQKLKLRCLSLKLDLNTIEKIEKIMEIMNVRTYNDVLRTCLNSDLTINKYYEYAVHINNNNNKIESLLNKI